jgi:hypothetical protein
MNLENGRKANDGVNCLLLEHVGKSHNSLHRMVVKCCEDLKNQYRHIQTLFGKQATKEVENSCNIPIIIISNYLFICINFTCGLI